MKQTRGWCMTAALTGGVLAGLTGCKPDAAVKQGQVIGNGSTPAARDEKPAAPPMRSATEKTLGSVSGTVHFTGKPPARVKIDMSLDPVCSKAGTNYSEQYVAHDGKLANVYVYVKSGPPAAMAAGEPSSAPVVLDQVGCRYEPHVIAVVQGGTVEFRNSDATMHNIETMPMAAGNQPFDTSQGPKGAPVTERFAKPETMIPVRCNLHPWMEAFINVSATPFFAVTDESGRFFISGLPAGKYTLAAMQEKLGEQDRTVTVELLGTAKADFTFNAR